jgi:hypothetical protein
MFGLGHSAVNLGLLQKLNHKFALACIFLNRAPFSGMLL